MKNHLHLNFAPEKNLDNKYKEDSTVKESAKYAIETIILFVIAFVLQVH